MQRQTFFRTATVITILIGFGSFGTAQDLEDAVRAELDSLIEVYKHLHSHPELSYHEKETAAYLAQYLRELGFEVTEGIGRYPDPAHVSYGLAAVMKNGNGPTVMVRTDLDGLPVEEKTGLPYASRVRTTDDAGADVDVMHACGHDVHMTSFLGTATLLSRLKSKWSGTLVMIGQPAEERGAGAKAMLEDGLYERFLRPDFALALHSNSSLHSSQFAPAPSLTLATGVTAMTGAVLELMGL